MINLRNRTVYIPRKKITKSDFIISLKCMNHIWSIFNSPKNIELNKNEFINNQAGTIDGDQTIENAVLAGPVTFPGTVTVTGTLVIV